MIFVGPLMDQNLVVWSRRLESKKEKEADIPWLMQKANTLLHVGTGHPLEWVKAQVPSQEGLRSPGKKVSSAASVLQGISQK